MLRRNKWISYVSLLAVLVMLAVGCSSKNSNLNISDEVRDKALDLVEQIDVSMNDQGISISNQDFLTEIIEYQQLMIDKGEYTKENGEQMIDFVKQMIETDSLTKDMKQEILISNKLYSYSQVLEDIEKLSLDEKKLDDIIYSLYFHAIEINSREKSGTSYSFGFVGGDEEEKNKAKARLEELENIKDKETKVLVEDYKKLYKEIIKMVDK